MATHVLETPRDTRDERRVLAVAGGAHLVHDGYTDLIYLLLPIWQPEFSLSYAAVGVLRALYTGTMAAFQVHAGPGGGAAAIVGKVAIFSLSPPDTAPPAYRP